MRLIAAAVLTTDIVSFERIGDFENFKCTATATRNLRMIDDLRWRPTSKFTSATRKARGNAGRSLRKVLFWRKADVRRGADVSSVRQLSASTTRH
jgi:hypothetical protein